MKVLDTEVYLTSSTVNDDTWMYRAYGCIENKFRMEFNDSDVHLS